MNSLLRLHLRLRLILLELLSTSGVGLGPNGNTLLRAGEVGPSIYNGRVSITKLQFHVKK